jgi:hypothetical protein
MLSVKEKETIITKNSRALTDFFKGIAIILVILVHSHQAFDLLPMFNAVQRFGQMGCQIFFVLSSLGLCFSYSKKQLPFIPFMKKRVSKLLIGYYGAIILHAVYRVLVAIMQGKDIVSSLNIPGIIINMLFLNGFVPINGINNTIVRGGWYVGTTVILYALFPLLYKIYFTEKNAFWKKYRAIIFPLAIFCITFPAIIIAGLIHPALMCSNNSFVYFSFVNQLTPFSLGLVLFDIKNQLRITKKTLLFSLLALIVSIILFFGEFQYSFVFCPSFVAISFLLLYMWVSTNQNIYNTINEGSNCIIRTILKFGANSFSIYLTHSFIVYEFSMVCLKFLHMMHPNDLVWYIVLLPIEFCLIFIVGYVYNKCIALLQRKNIKAE